MLKDEIAFLFQENQSMKTYLVKKEMNPVELLRMERGKIWLKVRRRGVDFLGKQVGNL